MVYGYDQAIQLPVRDLYDSGIMLMALGVAKDMYEKGEKRIDDFYTKYGNFITPIQKDQDYYNKNVIDAVRNSINSLYANGGDPLRNAQSRAELARVIRNIPYGEINKLKASAKNAEEYLKERARLEAAGLYNPELEQFAGKSLDLFSTLNDGIWDRMSPVPYLNMADFSKAYFDNISPIERMARKNGISYKVSEITEPMLQDIANRHFNDLVQTPQGRLMYEMYKSRFGSDEAARAAFNSAVVSGNLDRLKSSNNYEEMSLAQQKLNIAKEQLNISRERLRMLKEKNDPTNNNHLSWTGRQSRDVALNNKMLSSYSKPLQDAIKGSSYSGAMNQLKASGIKKPTAWQIHHKKAENRKLLGNSGLNLNSRELYAMNYRTSQTDIYGNDAITAAALAAGLNSAEKIGDIDDIKRAPMTFLGKGDLKLTNLREAEYAGKRYTKGSLSVQFQNYLNKHHVSGHQMYPEHVSVNYKPYGENEHVWDINTTITVKRSDLEGFGDNLDKALENIGAVSKTMPVKQWDSTNKTSFKDEEFVEIPVTRSLDSRGFNDYQIDDFHETLHRGKAQAAKVENALEKKSLEGLFDIDGLSL